MLRCLFTVRQHEIAVQHKLPFATPYCTTQNQLPRDWLDVVGRSTTYGFCTILDMCHVSRFPVHDHMSLPLHQYSYCADLILARMEIGILESWNPPVQLVPVVPVCTGPGAVPMILGVGFTQPQKGTSASSSCACGCVGGWVCVSVCME